jgi:hypothetical protein
MGDNQDFLMFGHPTNSSTYASADFEDANDSSSRYFLDGVNSAVLQDVISQSLTHHIQDASPSRPPINMTNWRKRLQEIMHVQTETILNFLVKPATEHSLIGPIETLIRTYSIRKEIDSSTTKTLQELMGTFESPGYFDQEVKECLAKGGPSSLTELRSQVTALVDMYKDVGEKIFETENQMRLRIEKLNKLHKNVSSILDLQVNSATEALVAGMEKYLESAAKDLNIDELYKDLVRLYSKHITLRESIQVFKIGSCLPSEPICSICLTDTISYAIVSCGHTFCAGCCRKMVYECGMCRGKIKEKMKIYIS